MASTVVAGTEHGSNPVRDEHHLRVPIIASVLLGIFLVLGGLAFASGNESTQSSRCLYQGTVAETYIRPGVVVDVGDSWWPLGTRCSYHYSPATPSERRPAVPYLTAHSAGPSRGSHLPISVVDQRNAGGADEQREQAGARGTDA